MIRSLSLRTIILGKNALVNASSPISYFSTDDSKVS